MNIFLEI